MMTLSRQDKITAAQAEQVVLKTMIERLRAVCAMRQGIAELGGTIQQVQPSDIEQVVGYERQAGDADLVSNPTLRLALRSTRALEWHRDFVRAMDALTALQVRGEKLMGGPLPTNVCQICHYVIIEGQSERPSGLGDGLRVHNACYLSRRRDTPRINEEVQVRPHLTVVS